MKRIFAGCLSAAAFVCALSAAQAQEPQPPMSSQKLEFSISSLNGIPVHGDARGVQGANYSAAVSVTVYGQRSVMHRLFLDHDHHIAFGYDLEAFPVEGQPRIHLHFMPLSSLSSFQGVDASQYQMREMQLPADRDVAISEPVDVPLEVSAEGNRMLRDKLFFGAREGQQ